MISLDAMNYILNSNDTAYEDKLGIFENLSTSALWAGNNLRYLEAESFIKELKEIV
jgi:hypothetical protein